MPSSFNLFNMVFKFSFADLLGSARKRNSEAAAITVGSVVILFSSSMKSVACSPRSLARSSWCSLRSSLFCAGGVFFFSSNIGGSSINGSILPSLTSSQYFCSSTFPFSFAFLMRWLICFLRFLYSASVWSTREIRLLLSPRLAAACSLSLNFL